ncbi:MAG: FHA domain-containing protein [Kiritimatiellaeota bacterium]|nr:FHA domain-containing protein [Kiritimatiellota bacterium]
MVTLIGMSAEVKGQSFDLDRDETLVGRRKESEVALDNSSISGRHCLIRREGRHYFVRDLGSTNGTRLNGREVNVEMRLRPKDILQAGALEFLFDSNEPPEEEAASRSNTTRIEITSGSSAKPESFASISPFGTRRPETMTIWYVIIAVVGLLALGAAIALFIYISRIK